MFVSRKHHEHQKDKASGGSNLGRASYLKALLQKGAPNLTTNPNRVVVKLCVYEDGLDLVIVGFNNAQKRSCLV